MGSAAHAKAQVASKLLDRGELRFGKAGEVWETEGVGSGIVICAACPKTGHTAMVYAMLPQAFGGFGSPEAAHFVDTSIAQLLERFEAAGCDAAEIRIAYAGGALGQPGDTVVQKMMNLGRRNQEAIEQALVSRSIPAVACHVGGTCARRVRFDTKSGRVWMSQIGIGESVLCDLLAPEGLA